MTTLYRKSLKMKQHFEDCLLNCEDSSDLFYIETELEAWSEIFKREQAKLILNAGTQQ